MKALFIGGTGTISMAITKLLLARGHEVTLVNRGSRNSGLEGALTELCCDVHDEAKLKSLVAGKTYDVVADFIAFDTSALERDVRVFAGLTKQLMFISSASAYQKPLQNPVITESTPLCNPYWQYSRNKIACEEYLMQQYRERGLPITIIRPSHTYDERSVPLGLHGENGSWQVVERMLAGKPVIIHGDGTSLWTMTHNSDFAKGFVGLMGNIHAIGEAFHITSDESLTWNQIYACIADALGKPLNAVHIASQTLSQNAPYDFTGSLLGDKANTVIFDNGKVKRLVPEFVCTKRFSDGVRETVAYVLSHPECQRPDPAFDRWCDKTIERFT